jgi:tellurite resistance protein TehA-like permease
MARTGTEYNIPHALNATVAMWWVALVASVLTSFVVPSVMFTRHNHAHDTLTAAWMLPIVPPITVAAAGATFSKLLIAEDRLEYALTVLLASYVMNGVGVLIALGLMVIYFQRLAVFHLPPREVIVSTFCKLFRAQDPDGIDTD